MQRWLYAGFDELNACRSNGVDNEPGLIGLAFCFGALHALLPGHGNSVLASYYAGDGQSLGALGSFRTFRLVSASPGQSLAYVIDDLHSTWP